MKKLRLLLLEECERNCEGCCNNDWDLDSLPICESYKGYDIIMLTGGEPMLVPTLVKQVIYDIRHQTDALVYVYIAKTECISDVKYLVHISNGICVTLHKQGDVQNWLDLSASLSDSLKKNRSLRLNVFAGVDIGNANTTDWIVKTDIDWIPNCPLPEGEIFMRLKR